MTPVFIILGVIMLLSILFEIKIIRHYKINIKKLAYRPINEVHKWGEIVIVILLVISLFVIAFVSPYALKPHYFALGIILLYGYRGLMEWKYTRASKNHLVTFLSSAQLGVVFLMVEIYFYQMR